MNQGGDEPILAASKAEGIHITAFSALGARGTLWASDQVLNSEVLKEMAEAKGTTIAQVIFFLFFFLETSCSVTLNTKLPKLKHNRRFK